MSKVTSTNPIQNIQSERPEAQPKTQKAERARKLDTDSVVNSLAPELSDHEAQQVASALGEKMSEIGSKALDASAGLSEERVLDLLSED